MVRSVRGDGIGRVDLVVNLIGDISDSGTGLFIENAEQAPSGKHDIVLSHYDRSAGGSFLHSFSQACIYFKGTQFLAIRVKSINRFRPSRAIVRTITGRPLHIEAVCISCNQLGSDFVFSSLALVHITKGSQQQFGIRKAVFRERAPRDAGRRTGPFAIEIDRITAVDSLERTFPVAAQGRLVDSRTVIDALDMIALAKIDVLAVRRQPGPFHQTDFLSGRELVAFHREFPEMRIVFPFLLSRSIDRIGCYGQERIDEVRQLSARQFIERYVFASQFKCLDGFHLRRRFSARFTRLRTAAAAQEGRADKAYCGQGKEPFHHDFLHRTPPLNQRPLCGLRRCHNCPGASSRRCPYGQARELRPFQDAS